MKSQKKSQTRSSSQKKSHSRSGSRSQSQKRKESTKEVDFEEFEKFIDDEEVKDLCRDISLKRPRTAYNLYILEKFQEMKKEEEHVLISDVCQKYKGEWEKLSDSEKEKYVKQNEKEKEKYAHDLDIVKHILVRDYDKQGASAQRLYISYRMKEAVKNEEDPKEASKLAKEEWKNLSDDEKSEWKEKKKLNDEIWNLAKKTRISAKALFLMDKRSKKDSSISRTEGDKMWEKASEKVKEKYEEKCEQIKADMKRARELLEIQSQFQPKKPVGAYKLFFQEMSAEGKLSGKNPFAEAAKLWEKLSESEKEEYREKNHILRLSYIYKSKINKRSKVKKPKIKTAFNFYAEDMKDKIKLNKGEKFLQICAENYKKLSEKELQKYIKLEEQSRQDYEKDMIDFSKKVYNPPPKPKHGFNEYMSLKIDELMKDKKYSGKPIKELFTVASSSWQNLSQKEQKKFEDRVQEEREVRRKQKEEYDENGYYTLDKEFDSKLYEKANAKLEKIRSRSQSAYKSGKKKPSSSKDRKSKSKSKKKKNTKK